MPDTITIVLIGLVGFLIILVFSLLVVGCWYIYKRRNRQYNYSRPIEDPEDIYEMNDLEPQRPLDSIDLSYTGDHPPTYDFAIQSNRPPNRVISQEEREKELRKAIRRQLRSERRKRRKKKLELRRVEENGNENENGGGGGGGSSMSLTHFNSIPIPLLNEITNATLNRSGQTSTSDHQTTHMGENETQVSEDSELSSGSERELREMEDQEVQKALTNLKKQKKEKQKRNVEEEENEEEIDESDIGPSSSSSKKKSKLKLKLKSKPLNKGKINQMDDFDLSSPTSSSQSQKKIKYKVLKRYKANGLNELSLESGDIILLTKKENVKPGFWEGTVKGKRGLFPNNEEYVQIIKPKKK